MNFISKSAQETKEFAQEIVNTLGDKNVICLYGNLGAGKTTFVQGLSDYLGVTTKVISPTFVLVRKHAPKIKFETLWHVDLYRLQEDREALELGITDMWNDRKSLVIIEWPEKIEHILPQNHIKVKIGKVGENIRNFVIS